MLGSRYSWRGGMSNRSPQNQLIRYGPSWARRQGDADTFQDVVSGCAPAGEFAAVDAEDARLALAVGAEYGFSRSIEGRLGRGREYAQPGKSLRYGLARELSEVRKIMARDGE